MPPQTPKPWQKRLRRLFLFVGTASTFYLLLSYAFDRMKEARVKALKEKRERDTIKSHFSSLTSTITFTLYSLLPTLQPQLFEKYPVESTSQALQSLSNTSSISGGSAAPTPENSLLLQGHELQGDGARDGGHLESTGSESMIRSESSVSGRGVGESWASEFEGRDVSVGESGLMSGTDDEMTNSTHSHSISLPGTDSSLSPRSDLSHSVLPHSPSPPRPGHGNDSSANLQVPSVPVEQPQSKSKKELWRDLKIQSITRSITTAYLVPLLYILTTSQLSILARQRYLEDVQAQLPTVTPSNEDRIGRSLSSATIRPGSRDSSLERPIIIPKKGWIDNLKSFSIDSMGLSEFTESTPSSSSILNPLNLMPKFIRSYLPSVPTFLSSPSPSTVIDQPKTEETDSKKKEAEHLFLSYSWWLLHEGWVGLADRVEGEVERVFGGVGLKREIGGGEWEGFVKEVRAGVESVIEDDGKLGLYDFTAHLLPPSPLPNTLTHCPLPSFPSSHSIHLQSLVTQTNQQISSPDARYLLDKGVSAMLDRLIDSLKEEYPSRSIPLASDVEGGVAEERKRLVDCLPVFTSWSRGVWEEIPAGGVEALLSVGEFESFAALIFGDWAPQRA